MTRVRLPRRATTRALPVSLIASAAIQGTNALTGVLLARALGPTGRGELTAVLLWPLALSVIGSFGVSDAATFFAARQRAAIGTLVGTLLVVAAVESVLLVSVGALIVPRALASHGHSVINDARLFLAVIPLSLATLSLMGVLNGIQCFRAFHALRLLVIVATAGSLLIVHAVGQLTVGSAVLGYLAANFVTLVAACAAMRHSAKGRLRMDSRLMRDLLTYGIKSHSSNVPSLLNERLDQLVISIFLAPARLGLYAVAVTMTSLTNLIGASVSYVALPKVARLAPNENRAAVAQRYVLFTFIVSAAFSIPLAVFAQPLISFMFGDSFVDATNVCRILLLAAIVLSTTRAVGAILKAVNRPLDAGIAETLALGVTIVALAALLPLFSITGAGIASLVAYLVSCVFSLRQAARALEIGSHRLLMPSRGDLRFTS